MDESNDNTTATTTSSTGKASNNVNKDDDKNATHDKSSAKLKSSAKARAEARRRRILEAGRYRIDALSGEEVAQTTISSTNTTVDSNSTSAGIGIASTTNKGSTSISTSTSTGATGDITKHDNVEENHKSSYEAQEKMETALVDEKGEDVQQQQQQQQQSVSTRSTSGASRLAQMRRRRYKKVSTVTNVTADDDNPPMIKQTKLTAEDATITIKPSSTEMSDTIQNVETSTTNKKKYMGVAKMRRKMLAEQKAATQQDHQVKNDDDIQFKVKPRPIHVPRAPVFFQLLTVICIFLAGFDVGLQNHPSSQKIRTLHGDLSIVDNGIGIFSLFQFKASETNTIFSNKKTVHDSTTWDQSLGQDEDEFQTITKKSPRGASHPKYNDETQQNIDPIFRVDLDYLTSGPGFLMAVTRLAVKFHRFLTYIFLTIPMNTFKTTISLPQKVLANPPILFLCALIFRYLGKHVLGGSIPDLDEVVNAHSAGSDNATSSKPDGDNTGGVKKRGGSSGIPDVLDLGKNLVKNYFTSTFPTLVFIYSLWKDARSDMYIILCGLFVGLVVPNMVLDMFGPSVVMTGKISEEL
eukprot:CAMPEP_0184870196 /NCGR_PEP_ID=MMETSP0580-20130426/36818_1 /TAXON_ID=1118495 /ORGANISM="Dactyliosolen fragilissimus" /LENGTH=578 /DNA_ID=CAMNT_0027372169 /DNA_START=9 /DNA_END=1745 /DNA_ORIENTATION=-